MGNLFNYRELLKLVIISYLMTSKWVIIGYRKGKLDASYYYQTLFRRQKIKSKGEYFMKTQTYLNKTLREAGV